MVRRQPPSALRASLSLSRSSACCDRHGLTYVEKRQPKHKDNLVEKTEEAIMMEYENQYSNGPHALKSKSRDRSRDSAQREGADEESARRGHP